MTAGDVKFSLAISCKPVTCRSTSASSRANTSVSGSVSEGKGIRFPCLGKRRVSETQRNVSEVGFEGGDLVDAALMAAAFKLGCGKGGDDLLSETDTHDAAPQRQHVRIIVFTRHPRGIEAIAERSAHTAHLVRSELFTLAAAAEDDPPVGITGNHGPADASADLRIVDRIGRIGAPVVDLMALQSEERDKVSFEVVAGVVRSD